MVKLLEKQYQERLEEEVAKVSTVYLKDNTVVCVPFEPSKNTDFIDDKALVFVVNFTLSSFKLSDSVTIHCCLRMECSVNFSMRKAFFS